MDITLRPARPEDAREMSRWFVNLTELAQWGGPDVRFPLSEDQMAGWIAESAGERPRLCLTAIDDHDVPIGHVQYLRDVAGKWTRLGRFGVARARRGQGFGRALFDRAVGYAFTEFGVERVILAVARDNPVAHDMYARSGFRDEREETSVRSADGVAYRVDMMGLSRAEWIKLNSAPESAAKVA
jgi:RimJ/RimL family protein N-acetyltransferase